MESPSRLLSISATNIPPHSPTICCCKYLILWLHFSSIFSGQQSKKNFLTLGEEADKPCRNAGKRKYEHSFSSLSYDRSKASSKSSSPHSAI
jgi:hypothetical protein